MPDPAAAGIRASGMTDLQLGREILAALSYTREVFLRHASRYCAAAATGTQTGCPDDLSGLRDRRHPRAPGRPRRPPRRPPRPADREHPPDRATQTARAGLAGYFTPPVGAFGLRRGGPRRTGADRPGPGRRRRSAAPAGAHPDHRGHPPPISPAPMPTASGASPSPPAGMAPASSPRPTTSPTTPPSWPPSSTWSSARSCPRSRGPAPSASPVVPGGDDILGLEPILARPARWAGSNRR